MRRRAFTLIELLVVITIIALLAGLVLAALSVARGLGRGMRTVQRMESALMALTRLGQEVGTTTLVLQREAGLGGVLEFRTWDGYATVPATVPIGPNGEIVPGVARIQRGDPPSPGIDDAAEQRRVYDAVARAWTADGATRWWPDPALVADRALPVVLAYPWGRQRAYHILEPWYAGAYDLAYTPQTGIKPATLTAAQQEAWRPPQPFLLRDLRTLHSQRLLTLAGILRRDASDAYLDDRNPNRPWNDAWGGPLVVASALFQPPANLQDRDRGFTNDIERQFSGQRVITWDRYLKEAEAAYGASRSCYLSIAAAGPKLTAPLGAPLTPADVDAVWRQACAVCQQPEDEPVDPQRSWTESAFDRPPWQGVKKARVTRAGTRYESYLSAPIELK